MDGSEPGLPPHPEVGSEARRPPRLSLLTRKRTYDGSVYEGESLTTTSSDPALFSGDEQESVGAENYTSKRKKKMFTGSWWSHHVKAGKEDRKKEFKRNYDSGIFMGSDSEPPSSDSFTSLDDELVRDQARADQARDNDESLSSLVGHLEGPACATPLARRAGKEPEEDLDTTPRKRLVIKRNEDHTDDADLQSNQSGQLREISQIIHQCLDEGQENIDLSGCSLSELPPEIGELAHLTKQTNFVVGMLESGASLETHLRLFLGNNFLRQLPLSLFSLTNLRELSLRRNKLTSLPAGIRHLVNLEKLNVSGNKLSHLPFEVINLVAHHRLRDLTTEPNLWETRNDDQVNQGQYIIRQLPLEPRLGLEKGACLSRAIPISQSSLATTSSSTPSLSEVVLRQLARIRPFDDLQRLMPKGTPTTVLASLDRLDKTLQEGGQFCNSCGRLIVCPGVEWIELWRVHHTYIPIRRVQCASGCEGTATRWCDAPSRED